jgi:hypothetical protein
VTITVEDSKIKLNEPVAQDRLAEEPDDQRHGRASTRGR